jgi:hypothetical protein
MIAACRVPQIRRHHIPVVLADAESLKGAKLFAKTLHPHPRQECRGSLTDQLKRFTPGLGPAIGISKPATTQPDCLPPGMTKVK